MTWCDVTDHGIQMLCYEKNGKLGCSLIEKMYVSGTAVTSIGSRMILMSQNNLTYFQSKTLISTLSELFQQFRAQNNIRFFSLRQVDGAYLQGYSSILQLYHAVCICPQLTISQLTIIYDNSMHELDQHVLRLIPNLVMQKLRFIGSSCPNVVFPFYSMTASPLRAEIGTRLQVLRLYSMKNVDTAAIIASCLNLKSLTLKFNDSFVYNEIPHSLKDKEYLQQLERFVFYGLDWKGGLETFPPESHISLFLASPKLKRVEMYECPSFTDAAVKAAFTRSHFVNLEFLDITSCNSITKAGLEPFKRRENSINYFSVNSCILVDSKLLKTEWKVFVSGNNWKIKIDFDSDSDSDSDSDYDSDSDSETEEEDMQ